MRPSNRRTQQPFVSPKSPIGYQGADGFYLFVPAAGFGLQAIPMGLGPKHAKKSRGKVPAPPQLRPPIMERPLASVDTFFTVAEQWFETNSSRWVETYRCRLRSRLNDDLLSELGNRNIAEIQPLDVLETIRKIEKRGAVESAKRILNMASSVFRYGVATSRCHRDPTIDIRGALRPPLPAKPRKALPAKEMSKFMSRLSTYDGDEMTRLALRLLILTFVRTGELRFAKWAEFENLGSKDALWRVPKERMKLRRPHLVPLAPQSVAILQALEKISGKGEYLFPAPTRSGVISENTLLYALYRMGYHNRATVHGFRATASTVLNEAQFNRDWIEMQLAHCDSSIRGVYNFAEWLPGRRKMMMWWARYLEGKC
jgi:integrase